MNKRICKFWHAVMGIWRLHLPAPSLAIFLFLMPGISQAQTAATCDFSGIWYNPTFPGDGFNVYETPSGWLIYFLGYDNWGLPFWVSTDLFQPGQLQFNETYALPLSWGYYVDGTSFETPAPPDALEAWGNLEIAFETCSRGTFTLEAIDGWNFGSKSTNVIKLTSKKPQPPSSCNYSGIWYNPQLPGEGFNVYETPSGWVIYFLGYDNFGTTVWVTSDLVQPHLSQPGMPFELPMSMGPYATGGEFHRPLPPGALELWGTLQVDFTSCTEGIITLDAIDQEYFGLKVAKVVKLVGVK